MRSLYPASAVLFISLAHLAFGQQQPLSDPIQRISANAGPNQTAKVGQIVTLDGSGSSDPSGAGPLSYSWKLVSRPTGSSAVLFNSTVVQPTFVVDAPGNYAIQLTVSNGVDNGSASVTVSTLNTPPAANAGPNQTAGVGTTVVLNGSRSTDVDGDPLTYQWSFAAVPDGSAAALVGSTAVSASFAADKAGTYVVRLMVSDGQASSTSTVTVTTQNSAPTAKAGVAQVVKVGTLVRLDGSGSTDVDGGPLTYQWSLIAAPAGSAASLSSATAVQPTFTVDVDGTYVAQLIVNDGKLASAPATVIITTNAVQPPTANAGPDQNVALNTLVKLNGTGTDPQGLALTYQWALILKPAGSAAALSSPSIPNPTFLADVAGTYVAQLIVNDGYLNGPAATVTITTGSNTAPVANAGADRSVNVGATVTLDASSSSDAENNPLTYSWSFLSMPAGSAAALNAANTVHPTFVADAAGIYVVQLIVNDGVVNSVPTTVVVGSSLIGAGALPASSAAPASNSAPQIAVAAGPAVGGVTPVSGSALNQTFTFTFSDSAGWQSLGVVNVLVNSALDGRVACYLAYVIQGNLLYLVTDPGTGLLPALTLNGTGSTSNSQCSVNGVGSSASGAGNTLTLTLNITFAATFSGNKIVYLAARDTGTGNSGWQPVGTWNVPAPAPNGPAVGGVSPSHSTSLNQIFVFTVTDTNGWQDIAVANALVNYGLDGRHACYLAFVPSSATSGTIYLVPDDGGTAYLTMTLPGNGSAQNSQCAISGTGSSVSGSGNNLVFTLNITFNTNFAGNRVIFMAARSNTQNSGWQAVGTVSVPSAASNPASIATNSGTPQSAAINTALPAPFVALVTDAGGNPVSGVVVTFTAPANGPSGSFAGNVNTATTDASGLATSAVFTLNGTAGAYTVSASAAGVAAAASFSVTNFGPPSAISTRSGTPQSASVNTAFALPFTVLVVDASNNPVNGVTVTFRAPFSGASGTFPGGSNVATATTDASGMATSPILTANDTTGSYTVTALAAGLPVPANFSLTNNTPDSGTIVLTTAIVGKGLQTTIDLTLEKLMLDPMTNTLKLVPSPAVGNVQVTLTSSDPSKLLLSGRQSDPGTASLVVGITDGSSTLTGIYVHGLVDNGTVAVTATATGYNNGGGIMTLTPSGFVVAGPGGIGVPFSANQGSNTNVTVMSVRLDSGLNVVGPQLLRAGTSASVTFTSSNTAVGTVTSPLAFQGGNNFSANPPDWPNISSVTTPFSAVSTGSTTLTVGVPAGFSTPAQGKTVVAGVNAKAISAPNVTVGNNLQTSVQVTLVGTAPAGGLTLTITSNNPSLVQLSTTAAGAGTASINVVVPEGFAVSPVFYIHGQGASGSATYTVSGSGYPNGTGTVTLAPSGFVIAGPFGLGQDYATTTASGSSTFTVYSVMLNGAPVQMALAGGISANVVVSSSNTAVGTISTSPVVFSGGSGTATTSFVPAGAGSTSVSVTQPSGFSSPGQNTSVTVTVTVPGMIVTDGLAVGFTLQTPGSVGLGAPAPPGGVTVTLTSNSALLRLSTDGTSAGSASIAINIPAGGVGGSFYLQSFGSSGSATYTATAPGYNSRTGTIPMTPSGPVIAGTFGLGTSFFQASVSGGNVPVTVYMAQLDPMTLNFVNVQPLAGGRSIQFTLSSSAPGIGTIASPVTLNGGPNSGNGVVAQFTPVSQGSTQVTVDTPAGGYTTPNITQGLANATLIGQVGP